MKKVSQRNNVGSSIDIPARNAQAVLFGFDFQFDSGIYLFFNSIKEAQGFKIEGRAEDIEVYFNDGCTLYAQAKSSTNPWEDAAASKKLREALESLSDAFKLSQQNKAEDRDLFVYISNLKNPTCHRKDKNTANVGIFSDGGILPKWRSWEGLDPVSKEKIKKLLNEYKIHFPPEKLSLVHLDSIDGSPNEMHQSTIQAVSNKLVEIGIDESIASGIHKTLLAKCLDNGGNKKREIKIEKSEIAWVMVVLKMQSRPYDDRIGEYFPDEDEDEVDDIIVKYNEYIKSKADCFQLAGRVISDYKNYECDMKDKKKVFVARCFSQYKDEFEMPGTSDELRDKIIKFAIIRILQSRLAFDTIRKGINL